MPDGVRIRIDTSDWDAYADDLERSTPILQKQIVKAVAFEGRREGVLRITQEGGVRTGRMRSEYVPRFLRGGLIAELTSRVQYFPFYDLGTAPHIIEPRRKNALFWKGADHPVRRVFHPGTRRHRITDRVRDHLQREGTRLAEGVVVEFIEGVR